MHSELVLVCLDKHYSANAASVTVSKLLAVAT